MGDVDDTLGSAIDDDNLGSKKETKTSGDTKSSMRGAAIPPGFEFPIMATAAAEVGSTKFGTPDLDIEGSDPRGKTSGEVRETKEPTRDSIASVAGTVAEETPFGESKPKRIIIRAKIIHDEDQQEEV